MRNLKIYLICTITAVLFAATNQDRNCEYFNEHKETKCVPFGPPNCTEPTDPLLECAERVLKKVNACEAEEDMIVTMGQMESIKLIREVICGDRDIQYAFRRSRCWTAVGNCAIASLYVPLEITEHNRTSESEVCQHEILQLEECSSQIEEVCGYEATTPSLNFIDQLLKKSKCSGKNRIKIAANLLLLTLLAIALAW